MGAGEQRRSEGQQELGWEQGAEGGNELGHIKMRGRGRRADNKGLLAESSMAGEGLGKIPGL